MKRICAFLIGFAVLLATPGIAAADPFGRPAQNQQAIDFVIARALSQRGVPYTYGGGNANGPSIGVPQAVTPLAADPATGFGTPQVAPGAPGLVPGLNFPGLAPPAAAAAPVADPSANVVGFDASGLIVYAFGGVGLKLPRSSGEQYKVGQKVLPSQALPGDLIFFGPDGTQSVAMFVGNGQMVEATNPVVKVSPVRTDPLAPYLVRIIP